MKDTEKPEVKGGASVWDDFQKFYLSLKNEARLIFLFPILLASTPF